MIFGPQQKAGMRTITLGMIRGLLMAALSVLSFGVTAVAQLMIEGTPRSEYLNLANVTMAPYSASVGGLYYDFGGVNEFAGSTFYIGGGIFLACAHQTIGSDGHGAGIGNTTISFGANLNTPPLVVPVDGMAVHSLYQGDVGSPFDIVMFQSSASSLDSVPALSLWNGTAAVGTRFIALGYGGFGYPGATSPSDGLLSGYENEITRFGSPGGIISDVNWFSRFGWPGDPEVTRLEGMGLPGFSGGPKLVAVGGTYQVGALNAFWWGRQDYGGYDGGLGLSSLTQWIDTTRTTIPEPSVAALLPLGLFALVAFRRRIM